MLDSRNTTGQLEKTAETKRPHLFEQVAIEDSKAYAPFFRAITCPFRAVRKVYYRLTDKFYDLTGMG